MHPAREELDNDIRRTDETRSMLGHLADTIEADAPQRGGETYRDDMVAALRHGADIVRDRQVNLMHVAQIWDEKVARPVPDPVRRQDPSKLRPSDFE